MMKIKKISCLWAGFILLSLSPLVVTANDGAQLYATKACIGCHGPEGNALIPTYPSIAGQNEAYLYNQMRDIKDGNRSNGQSIAMKGIMAGVSEEEMRTLAAWLAAL